MPDLLLKNAFKSFINLTSVRKNSRCKMKSILVCSLTVFSHPLITSNLQMSFWSGSIYDAISLPYLQRWTHIPEHTYIQTSEKAPIYISTVSIICIQIISSMRTLYIPTHFRIWTYSYILSHLIITQSCNKNTNQQQYYESVFINKCYDSIYNNALFHLNTHSVVYYGFDNQKLA